MARGRLVSVQNGPEAPREHLKWPGDAFGTFKTVLGRLESSETAQRCLGSIRNGPLVPR